MWEAGESPFCRLWASLLGFLLSPNTRSDAHAILSGVRNCDWEPLSTAPRAWVDIAPQLRVWIVWVVPVSVFTSKEIAFNKRKTGNVFKLMCSGVFMLGSIEQWWENVGLHKMWWLQSLGSIFLNSQTHFKNSIKYWKQLLARTGSLESWPRRVFSSLGIYGFGSGRVSRCSPHQPLKVGLLALSVGLSLSCALNHLTDLTIAIKPFAEEAIDCPACLQATWRGWATSPRVRSGTWGLLGYHVFSCPRHSLLQVVLCLPEGDSSDEAVPRHQLAAHHDTDLKCFSFQIMCWTLLLCICS